MIVVTGATGHLGRGILEKLLPRVPTGQLAASARDPEKATELAKQGVTVRQGDFADPASLATAFAGATQVLVVSPNVLGEEGQQLTRNAVEAAQAAGVHRVLYTSHMAAQADSAFAPAVNHAAAEALLAKMGMPYTSLRNGYYAESAMFHIGRAFETGELRAPEDGPVSWTTRADLAEANAAVLAEEGSFDGNTPPLVAPEAFTLAELAAIASELLGREVKRMVITDAQWRDEKIAQGLPAPVAELLLGSYRAMRRGEFAATGPVLEQLLGRRPHTMRDVLTSLLRPTVA
ncbi:MAG: SDR family oxidoreductase [Janthinobacterium lividum]